MERKQRRLLMVLAMALIVGLAASAAQAQTSYWKFDELSGTISYDSVGWLDGVFMGGDPEPEWVDDLVRGRVIKFDDGGYVNYGTHTELNLDEGDFSVSVWIKVDEWTGESWEYFFAHYDGNNWRMGRYSGNDNLRWTAGSGGPALYTPSGQAVDDGLWHNLIWIKDSDGYELFFDGVSCDTSSDTDNPRTAAVDFTIGSRGTATNRSGGFVDDFFLTHEAWDADDVAFIAGGGDPLARWNFPPLTDIGPPKVMIIPPKPMPPLYTIYPGELEIDGVVKDSTPWPAGDPCDLTVAWEVLTTPPGGSVIFTNGLTDLQNTLIFKESVIGVYRLVLHATDGFFEVNDYIVVDVKHYNYTGMQNHWAFENDLHDTAPLFAPYSTTDDYLEDRGLIPTYYGTGVIGQAIHVGHTDYGGKWAWLESPFPHTSTRPDLDLNDAFTVEMYIQPTPEMATGESDQLDWQDLVGRFFTYTPGQETFYESYEFLVDEGRLGMNVADITDTINAEKDTDYLRMGTLLGAHAFPKTLGWQHIAFAGDGTGAVTFYIDGESIGTGNLPNAEFVQTVAPLRVANPLVNAHGGVGRPSPYVGWIDELRFFEYFKPASYMRDRARLIPIQSPTPTDGYQLAYPDTVLSWAPVKGFSDEIPTYDVYFERDGVAFTTPVVSVTDNFYDPCEAGGVTDLDFDTIYHWQVVAQTSVGPISGDEWFFKTIPADFLGLDGTALIGHWKLDEGIGTDAHDSALPDDVGRYRYPAVGDKFEPLWIPGWIAANPATGLRMRLFEYVVIEPDDINQYIDLPRDSYTLATWMKTTPEFIFDNVDFIGFGLSYGIGRNEGGQEITFYHAGFSGNVTDGATAVGDGYWHHVAAVYEAPTITKETIVSVYVDGQLDGTEEVDGNHGVDPMASLILGANSAKPNNFTGALDDVRIYQRALSADEIEALYDMGIVNSPPIVHAGTNAILPFPGIAQPFTIDLETLLTDDSAPLQQSPRTVWTQLAGPGTVTFDPCIIEGGDHVGFVNDVENIITTTLTFSETGFYKVRFKADDTIYTHEDYVRIWVQEDGEEGATVAYWRFEEDSDPDPNTLEIANEITSGPPLIAVRNQPEYVPRVTLDAGVKHSVIPLTSETNVGALSPGIGEFNFFGRRMYESGLDLELNADTWDGMVFCEDGITIELYCNLDPWVTPGEEELEFGFVDAYSNEMGVEFFQWDYGVGSIYSKLTFQFYITTDVPNEYLRVCILSDIDTYQTGWKHVAFTYDKTTGIARVYEDGIPSWLTYHVIGNTWYQNIPWVDHWQLEPGRTFVMSEELPLIVFDDLETVSYYDELRITAKALEPQDLLILGPAMCAEKVQGDLDGDCDVDVFDLKIFCDSWLMCNNADPTQCFK